MKKTTYSVDDLSQLLGLQEGTVYGLISKGHFEVVEALGKRRVTRDSFEKWYASQSVYRTVEDQSREAEIISSTYSLPEIARMLGVPRQTVYYIADSGKFDLVKIGRQKRATKQSFEKWYQSQSRLKLKPADEKERG